ncbi:hypothetical protein CEXT_661691 [Caerostris extrusa]|uniref:Uncharacterized protein n=1 Tax=Caerostris extrusa TaxID=172846 RepID=A0AAV4S321_CAEEX|nr:hypothetical protein CEXT_661691 [Caerostris extrusa]
MSVCLFIDGQIVENELSSKTVFTQMFWAMPLMRKKWTPDLRKDEPPCLWLNSSRSMDNDLIRPAKGSGALPREDDDLKKKRR